MRIRIRSNVLYQLRKSQGISRNEQARRLGVSNATAYRADQGTVDPSPKFIAGLIAMSGQTFEELFELVSEDAA